MHVCVCMHARVCVYVYVVCVHVCVCVAMINAFTFAATVLFGLAVSCTNAHYLLSSPPLSPSHLPSLFFLSSSPSLFFLPSSSLSSHLPSLSFPPAPCSPTDQLLHMFSPPYQQSSGLIALCLLWRVWMWAVPISPSTPPWPIERSSQAGLPKSRYGGMCFGGGEVILMSTACN